MGSMRSNAIKKLTCSKHFSSFRMRYMHTVSTKEAKKTRQDTVDQMEVDHHEKMAHDWWDEKGEMKALHSMNSLRVTFVRNGLINVGQLTEKDVLNPHYLKGLSILDVGCGGGLLCEPLARVGGCLTGLDPSRELIGVAQAHASLSPELTSKINYITSTIEEHAETNANLYDVVISSEVIEHVTRKEDFIRACVATLKPGGSIFLTTINRSVVSYAAAIVMAEYVLRLLPRGTHDWNKFISPTELSAILEKFSCKTKLVNGMFYNPLTNEWSWISSTAVNFVLHAVKANATA